MELPSKMNSELESNNPPPRLRIPYSQFFACQDFLKESPTPFHERCYLPDLLTSTNNF